MSDFKKKSLKYPLVVKPIYGTYGKNVFMNITNITMLIDTVTKLIKAKKFPMIEEQIHGDIFRILVFNGSIIDIYKKEPAYIIGNGVHTLLELIRELRLDKKMEGGYMVKSIDWNYIKNQGYKKNDIIPINTKIILTLAANVNNGAIVTPINIEDVDSENIRMFKRLNKLSNLNLNGIDYISYDLKVPHTQYGYVLENNARPGVEGHYMMNPNSLSKFVRLIRF